MRTYVAGDALVIVPEDVPEDGPPSALADWLGGRFWLGKVFLAELVRRGRVRVQGMKDAHLDTPVVPGRRVSLCGGVEADAGVPGWYPGGPWPPARVLFEDDHALVADKPAGIIVHPGGPADGVLHPADRDTLAHRVAQHFALSGLRRQVRHVHRLDRETTGAVLYAKHEYSARTFDALLRARRVKRSYVALVAGRLAPAAGTVDLPIGRDRHVAGRFRVSASGRPAVTHYRTVAVAPGNPPVSLVALTLETGRTHQIRVHLAHLGCPVLGDALYGCAAARRLWPPGAGHALHAATLSFDHPYAGGSVTVTSPLPDVWQDVLQRFGLHHGLLPGAQVTLWEGMT
ncbi:hypothetical protein GCM10010885_22210 [Alicyclobacillus cellulosilyticus]|uniref:Pseudouridine synthase n=1 Tax=Alicyclobacillus cellulosilyticus TaxID=1003997 RepID=A0A917KHD4_9BACL|nr:RluA family pseudouridine synthase [Alicyclobacillus cellulosilyticus]GGJ12386.1 hypothetical protein GCM10010885_22210 [Alicyclobacillus cellulosilyticus]